MGNYTPLPGFSIVRATRGELAQWADEHPERTAPHRLAHDPCGERMWAVGRYTAHITRCPAIAELTAALDQAAQAERATYGEPPHRAAFDAVFGQGIPVLDHQLIEATAVPVVQWCYLATRKHNAMTFRIDLTRYERQTAESFAEMLRGPWVGYAEVRVLDAGRVDAFIAAGIIVTTAS